MESIKDLREIFQRLQEKVDLKNIPTHNPLDFRKSLENQLLLLKNVSGRREQAGKVWFVGGINKNFGKALVELAEEKVFNEFVDRTEADPKRFKVIEYETKKGKKIQAVKDYQTGRFASRLEDKGGRSVKSGTTKKKYRDLFR